MYTLPFVIEVGNQKNQNIFKVYTFLFYVNLQYRRKEWNMIILYDLKKKKSKFCPFFNFMAPRDASNFDFFQNTEIDIEVLPTPYKKSRMIEIHLIL